MPVIPGTDLDVSDVPLRRVIRRGSTTHNGRFASRKMGRTIPWESSNELAFLTLAELDADIVSIRAQPIEFRWQGGSGPRRHIPDFAVVRGTRLEIHEVKPRAAALKPEVREAAAWAERHCRNRGATYGMALAETLKAEPAFANAKAILRRLHDRLDETLALGTVEHLRRREVMPIGELTDWLSRWGGTAITILTLAAHNRVALDLDSPFHRDGSVWSTQSFPRHPRALPLATSVASLA